MAGLGRKVWAADEILAAADLQSYIQDQVVFVFNDASARTSGILAPTEGMVSYLKDTNLLYAFDGATWVEIAPNVGTPGTYTKVTTDAKGRVSSGTTLSASDIPALDSSKITTGTFNASRISGGDLTNIGSITTSVFGTIIGGTIWVKDNSNNTTIDLGGSTGRITAKDITVQQTLNVSSTAGFAGSVYSASTYNQTNSGRAVYVASDGLLGVGGSSERFKENIVDAKFPVDAVRNILVREFDYRDEFGGTHQVGVIAEELVKLGLEAFVYFDADGVPDGVAYDKLALAVLSLVQVESARLDDLTDRVKKLESK